MECCEIQIQIQIQNYFSVTLRYLKLVFNSHYIPVKSFLKQAAIIISHSHLHQVISKQAAIKVSHFHLLLFFGAYNFTLFSLAVAFTSTLLYIMCCPFTNKQLSIDSFLDWKGCHWVFISILQTTASDALSI